MVRITHARQAMRITRERTEPRTVKTTTETVYALTSVSAEPILRPTLNPTSKLQREMILLPPDSAFRRGSSRVRLAMASRWNRYVYTLGTPGPGTRGCGSGERQGATGDTTKSSRLGMQGCNYALCPEPGAQGRNDRSRSAKMAPGQGAVSSRHDTSGASRVAQSVCRRKSRFSRISAVRGPTQRFGPGVLRGSSDPHGREWPSRVPWLSHPKRAG